MLTIAVASDHNGVGLKYPLKLAIAEHFIDTDDPVHFIDLGPFTDDPVDYTTYANLVGNVVANNDCDLGILICGTGVGMSIAANKVHGVRAALVHNAISAINSKVHNDANVLCMGAWVTTGEQNIAFAKTWIETAFGEGRHVRRVEQIERNPNRIVFANGVFDILHQGHIEMLRWAKGLGSWLVVGINSDASVRAIKGENRPINGEAARKAVLETLRFVDEVIVFDDTKATALIEAIHPAVVVKGAEWKAAEVRERDMIPAWCDVKVFPLIAGQSTTGTINKVRELYAPRSAMSVSVGLPPR